jgi:SAM-dependent methyltransferase
MSDASAGIDAAKSRVLLDLIARRHVGELRRALVVGCGSGREAGILARHLGAETIGIDLGGEFALDHEASRPATLLRMDAQALQFADASFDHVYSFHALEHIPDYRRALAEMSRVLRPGGSFCIGTPNRARLVGYIGSSAPARWRILWNLQDLACRLTGRWSNEQGAHAGFYADELGTLCREHFGDAEEVTDSYYLALYPGRRALVERLAAAPWKYRLLPCVYFAGRRTEALRQAA